MARAAGISQHTACKGAMQGPYTVDNAPPPPCTHTTLPVHALLNAASTHHTHAHHAPVARGGSGTRSASCRQATKPAPFQNNNKGACSVRQGIEKGVSGGGDGGEGRDTNNVKRQSSDPGRTTHAPEDAVWFSRMHCAKQSATAGTWMKFSIRPMVPSEFRAGMDGAGSHQKKRGGGDTGSWGD